MSLVVLYLIMVLLQGCPKELACSIVLKGEIQSQLHAIAKVVEFTTYAAYHMRLELAFLLDETAISTASLAAAVQGDTWVHMLFLLGEVVRLFVLYSK